MLEQSLTPHILVTRSEFEKELETIGYSNKNANGGLFGKLVRNNLDDPRKWTGDNIAYQGILGKGLEGSLISVTNLKKNIHRLDQIRELGEASITMCVELIQSSLPDNT
jgi:hypothetical protein